MVQLWRERTARWQAGQTSVWHLTPSAERRAIPSTDAKHIRGTGGSEEARLVGVVAHRILEGWDFTRAPAELLTRIIPTLDLLVPAEQAAVRSRAVESLTDLFTTFGASQSYTRLASVAILGREVPFIMPWGKGQVMEGVIDLMYRLDGKIWIADYKTDRISASEASMKAESYAYQAAIYREAATRCLHLSDVSFQFLFLRAGMNVDL